MKTKTIFTLAILGMLATSCGAEKEKEHAEDTEKTDATIPGDETHVDELAMNATYSVVEGTEEVKWTAFKLTEKVGIGGAFTTFKTSGYNQGAASVVELMQGSFINIETASVATNNEGRDVKIVNSFFGNMIETTEIDAEIVFLEGVDGGAAIVRLKMNYQELEQEFSWNTDGDSIFILKGAIDVLNWDAQLALDSLNAVCSEKHKGADGVSVTWPNVEIKASVNIKKG